MKKTMRFAYILCISAGLLLVAQQIIVGDVVVTTSTKTALTVGMAFFMGYGLNQVLARQKSI